MIIRILAVDPNPPDKANDTLVFQVPEHSRNAELLTELFDRAHIEWVIVDFGSKTTKVKKHKGPPKPCEACGRLYHRGPAKDCPAYLEKKGLM